MPTEEELEQRITDLIQQGKKEVDEALDAIMKDSKERVKQAILSRENKNDKGGDAD